MGFLKPDMLLEFLTLNLKELFHKIEWATSGIVRKVEAWSSKYQLILDLSFFLFFKR